MSAPAGRPTWDQHPLWLDRERLEAITQRMWLDIQKVMFAGKPRRPLRSPGKTELTVVGGASVEDVFRRDAARPPAVRAGRRRGLGGGRDHYRPAKGRCRGAEGQEASKPAGRHQHRVALLDWENTLHDGWTLDPRVRSRRHGRLVVGNADLAAEFPGTSLLVEPRVTTGDDIRRGLDRLL